MNEIGKRALWSAGSAAAGAILMWLVLGSPGQDIEAESAAFVESAASDDLAGSLEDLGWLAPETVPGAESFGVGEDDLEAAIRAYADQWLTVAVGASLDAIRDAVKQDIATRECSVADNFLVEEANIPVACREDYGIYFDWSNFRQAAVGFSRAEIEVQFDRAMDEFNRPFVIRLHKTTDFGSAKCVVEWDFLTGTTLAFSSIASNDCRDNKGQTYDLRDWARMGIHTFFITATHEFGHLIGMLHSRDGVLKPQIDSSYNGLQPADERQILSLGYKRRARPPPEPEEPDNPGPPDPPKNDVPIVWEFRKKIDPGTYYVILHVDDEGYITLVEDERVHVRIRAAEILKGDPK